MGRVKHTAAMNRVLTKRFLAKYNHRHVKDTKDSGNICLGYDSIMHGPIGVGQEIIRGSGERYIIGHDKHAG